MFEQKYIYLILAPDLPELLFTLQIIWFTFSSEPPSLWPEASPEHGQHHGHQHHHGGHQATPGGNNLNQELGSESDDLVLTVVKFERDRKPKTSSPSKDNSHLHHRSEL